MNIKAIISALGISQSEFSKDLDIPVRTVQDWVSGKRKPPEYLVALIAEHYHIAASE